MRIYDVNEARTDLSRLIERAVEGESFVIAKAGKPMVKVMAIDAPEPLEVKRVGFMAGQIKVPDDFNAMGSDDIQEVFKGGA